MTPPVRIAQLSCGPDYSGVQHEIEAAAHEVNGEIFFPDIASRTSSGTSTRSAGRAEP